MTEEGTGDNVSDIGGAGYSLHQGTREEPLSGGEVRAFVQEILSRSVNLATLLGSGASTPAIGLMKATFTGIEADLKSSDPELFDLLTKKVDQYCDLRGGNPAQFSDIEAFLSWLDHRVAGDADQDGSSERVFGAVIKGFLSSVSIDYGDAKARRVLETYQEVVQGLGMSRQILARHGQTVFDVINLFTTNYDLFHESALESSGYAYTDGFSNGTKAVFKTREFHQRPIDLDERFRDHYEPVNPFFRLYKLHGSVNWFESGEATVRESPWSPPSEAGAAPALISPMSSKYELTQGAPYSDLFREFVNVMAVPNTVLFVSGFSFGDAHITSLVRQALERTDFTLVAFIGNPRHDGEDSPTRRFFESVSAPNAFFVYPKGENGRPLRFDEVAHFMRPDKPSDGMKDDQGIGDHDER